jgi:predicted acylesterase/phospholipase RssA
MSNDRGTGGTAVSVEAIAAAETMDFLGGQKLEEGIGLCLSGGGFRAMLFHLGAFIRMNELGLLANLDRVASVSGGSIAAGALAVAASVSRQDAAGLTRVTSLLVYGDESAKRRAVALRS